MNKLFPTGVLSRLLAVSCVTVLCAAFGWAQAGRGGVSGLITDSSGAAIAGARVVVSNPATGLTQRAVTTSAGLYSVLSLAPGTYTLTVTQNGFQKLVQHKVPVEVDRTTTVNLTLKPGTVSQTVEVTAAPPLTDTVNSTVGQLITAQAIQSVPLNGRDVYQLVQLSSGVIPVNGTVNNTDFNARPGAEVSGYTINGQAQGTLSYLLDGSPLSIAENNQAAMIPSFTPPVDAVQEYQVETNNLSAAYQSFGAGAISLVSKSGTNAFHGDAFFYLRPNALAANDSFAKADELENGLPNKPLNFHRDQWGAAIGGPIRHNKIFFFADYEGTRSRTLDTYTGTVPTAAERQGDFSDLVDPATGKAVTIYNPFDVNAAGQRQPFANNKIPDNLQNPTALAMEKFYPLPNRPGTGPYHVNNYYDQSLAPNDAQKFDLRIDDAISDRQQIFGRFSFDRLFFGNASHFHNAADPNHYENRTNGRNFLLADNYVLSPNTMLEFRYSYVRHYENQTVSPGAYGFDITSVGFPSSLAQDQMIHDIPRIDVGGMASIGSTPWTTFRFASMNHDFIAALNTVQGRQTLKMGVEVEKQFMNEGQPISPSGWYIFDNTATSSATWDGNGDAFASFLLGMGSPSEWQPGFTYDDYLAESNPYYATYLEDDVRLSDRLTVNLGVRWDIFGGRNERYNRLESFDPGLNYTVNGVDLTGGEVFVHNHNSPYSTNYGNIDPRIGFAYQLSRRAVVRGGFGIFHGPSSHMVSNGAINSDSFYSNTLWNATTTDAAGNSVMLNSLSNPFPNGVVKPTNGSLGAATNLGGVLATVLRSQPDPEAYNFNFGLQYELPGGYIASASWVGSRGLHQVASTDLNQLSLQQIAQYGDHLNDLVPNPYEAAITDPTSPLYGKSTIPRWQALEAFPQFGSGSPSAGVGVASNAIQDSIYHSLQAKVEKRLTAHFSTLASFTWGKLIGDGEGPISFIGAHAGMQDWRNMGLDRSLSTQDVSRWFSWQASYDLPIGPGRLISTPKGLANTLLGGWTVNSVLSLGTGLPIIVTGSFANQSTFFSQRPDLTCDAAQGAPKTAQQWFLPTCFAAPASPYVAGTAPRTLPDLRSDGTSNLDMSVFKNFALGEHQNVQFRAEAFNVTNSVQLGLPNSNWNPNDLSTFGQITSAANTPRQLQFALRYTF